MGGDERPSAELIEGLLRGATGRREEKEILRILREASPSELDAVLREVDTAKLVHDVDDHLIGGNHNEQLLALLVQRARDGDLGVHATASLLRGVQTGWTGRRGEEAIRDLVLMWKGAELSHLKNTVNLSTDRHDLEGLVYADITDEQIRRDLLAHFAAESSIGGRREAKILSDIDDTALARIHEKRYPKGAVIPGVLAFYEALDVGPDDAPVSRGDLTFVTARPSDALGLMKGSSRRTLVEAGVTNLSIMTGSWFNVATHDSMAAKKLENIAHYAELFPEYDIVFVGDSGQGDISVAEKLVETHGDVVRGVFIHDVVATPQAERDVLAEKGIWLIDTYVGAAGKAREIGLVSEAGFRDVVTATRESLDAIRWDDAEQERATRVLVEQDVEALALG